MEQPAGAFRKNDILHAVGKRQVYGGEVVSLIKRIKCAMEAFKKGKSISELETENKRLWYVVYMYASKVNELRLKLDFDRITGYFSDYWKDEENFRKNIFGFKDLDGILVKPEDET